MKLDFSALTQPAGKARGQVGTTGTQASMRVSASPLVRRDAGTCGDKPTAVMIATDLPVAVPAACPPVSPARPHVADKEKPTICAASPVSPLVPDEPGQVAAAAPSERDDLGGKPTHANVNTCADCLHLLRRGTCGEPVAAGLVASFGIVWPPEDHGAACAAFSGKTPTAAAKRPHRLTNDEADRCHATCWDDGEIAAFTARTARFAQMDRADADDLADRLTLRDRDGDDRRLCLECSRLDDAGRCLAAASGRIPGADRRLEPVKTMLQRCAAFELRKGLV